MMIKSLLPVFIILNVQTVFAESKEETKTAVVETSLEQVKIAEKGFSLSDWTDSFKAALKKDDKQAVQSLIDFKSLEKSALEGPDKANKEKMAKARELFAAKKYDEALNTYNQIPRGSDYWFQAIEEKGWCHYRKNETEKAIAQSKTLLSPPFSEIVDSEAFYLQSISQLKICDYKNIFATHDLFKDKQKSRISEIQKLAETGTSEFVTEMIKKVEKLPLEGKDMASTLLHLPVLYYKDIKLQSSLLKYKVSSKALEMLESHDTTHFFEFESPLEKSKEKSLIEINNRIAELAAQETEANKKVIQKLNLIEVEAIQRIHTDLSIDPAKFKNGQFKDVNQDELVFMDDGHPWIDELDKFEVKAKACPQNLRRKM